MSGIYLSHFERPLRREFRLSGVLPSEEESAIQSPREEDQDRSGPEALFRLNLFTDSAAGHAPGRTELGKEDAEPSRRRPACG